jgi:cytochrome c oxidase subunit 2
VGDLPLFPKPATEVAGQVDALYLFLIALSVFFSILIASLLAYFAIRYRRRSAVPRGDEPTHMPEGNLTLEILWTAIPFVLAMTIFAWGAVLFFHINRAPDDAMDVNVVAKRWMWKLQHMNGRREINELHVPIGRAVRLTMTSEDVIHSFFVPAFRVKADVLPGRYTSLWFKPNRAGTYHLFCAEYCGTKHSGMIGSIVVMEPEQFQAWLAGEVGGATPAAAGETLFRNLGCVTCHNPDSKGRGPSLVGLYGREVKLEGGRIVAADEGYLRESIVNPRARLVEGYQPLMPTFQGLISEEGLMQIIEYIKSVKGTPAPAVSPTLTEAAPS